MKALDTSHSTRPASSIPRHEQTPIAADEDCRQPARLRTTKSPGTANAASRHAAALLASRHSGSGQQKLSLRIPDSVAVAAAHISLPEANNDGTPWLKSLCEDPESLTRAGNEQQLDTVLRQLEKLTEQHRHKEAKSKDVRLDSLAHQEDGERAIANDRSRKFDRSKHERRPSHSGDQEQQRVTRLSVEHARDRAAGALQDERRGEILRRDRLASKPAVAVQKSEHNGTDQPANDHVRSRAGREQDALLAAPPQPQPEELAEVAFTRGQLRYLMGFLEQESRTNQRAAQLHGALALLDQEIARTQAAEPASEKGVAHPAIGMEDQSVAGSKAGKPPAEQSSLQSWVDKLDQLARALAGASGAADHALAMQFLLSGQLLEMPVPSLVASGAKRAQYLKIAASMVDRLMQMEHLIERHEQGELAGKLKQAIFDQRQRWQREIDDNATRPDPSAPGQPSPASGLDHNDTFFHRQVGSL
ncbi:hypothetical protein [Lacisediminimonas sp.]|uniref:hypothetical protein n=1 Tax=Lacisediminimonas sp. TaxID=3060582 RepID=UPI0027177C8F|nr:hypothetical protein [Lacisediminimonas sp.]MDO8301084.1 hypothetical protein [Lacisediminimonas sp.]